jgi:hypothetical protein
MGHDDDASVVRRYAKIAGVEVNAGADARNFAAARGNPRPKK